MRFFFKIVFGLLLAFLLAGCDNSGSGALSSTSIPTCTKEMSGRKPGVLTGSLQDVELDTSEFRNDLLRLTTVSDMIVALKSRSCDFILLDSVCAIGAQLPEKGIAFIYSTTPAGDYGMAFRKDEQKICDAFNAFLAEVRSNGIYDEAKSKWLASDPEKAEMPDLDVDDSDWEPFVIGTSPFYPFSYLRGDKWVGFEMDLVVRFAHSIHRKPVFLNIDFGGLIAALVSGKIDMISSCLSISEERAKSVLFSDGYYYAFTGCFVRAEDYGIEMSSSQEEKSGLWQRIKTSFHNNFIVDNRYKLLLYGAWETIVLSVFSILLGTLFGALLCLMKFSLARPIRNLANGFCSLMGGLPILVILMIMFYVVFASADISARWVAIIAFSMNFGAGVSSILFSGINAIDKGQKEGGLALGFSSFRTFFNFIFPQVIRNVMPLYKGEAVSLVKSTSVVGYIAIQDLTKVSDIIRARTFDAFFPLIVISIIYFLLAWLLGLLLDRIAKKI